MSDDKSDEGFNFVPFRTVVKDNWVQLPNEIMNNLGLEDGSQVCILVVLGDGDANSYSEIDGWVSPPEEGI